uniref:Uncharacterized protein n=1 Tax=Fundulus heteroclitus TaxID=8078 RepID=A0A3Q2P4G1_FUNHE
MQLNILDNKAPLTFCTKTILQFTCLQLLFLARHQCTKCNSSTEDTIYRYQARTLNGSKPVSFADFAGTSVLFVNVATY